MGLAILAPSLQHRRFCPPSSPATKPTQNFMNTPAAARPSRIPNPAPTGLWKVLCIIAERLPQKYLLWLAVIVCVSGLGFAAIACVSIGRVVTSKPATALAGFIEQHTVEKPANAP